MKKPSISSSSSSPWSSPFGSRWRAIAAYASLSYHTLTSSCNISSLYTHAFVVTPPPHLSKNNHKWQSRQFSNAAEDVTTTTNSNGNSNIDISPIPGDEASIRNAAEFMVHSFWLNSPQNLLVSSDQDGTTTNADLSSSSVAMDTLLQAQATDFMEKYGERMGKPLLSSLLLSATNPSTGERVGLAGMDVCILDTSNSPQILGPTHSEQTLKTALSTLGPKDRRRIKDYTPVELVKELLSPDMSAVVCLSNLAVLPSARRSGVAARLCCEAERVARDEWGYGEVYLKVEAENTAARGLYEGRLGYQPLVLAGDEKSLCPAVRVDASRGVFVETVEETLILKKDLDT